MMYPNFQKAVEKCKSDLLTRSYEIFPSHWQGVEVSNKPEMAMREILNTSLTVPVWTDLLAPLQKDIEPNLPWADDHFDERVCGQPLNPGVTWKTWPWGHNAEKFMADGMYNHSYAERYFPRLADKLGPLIVPMNEENWEHAETCLPHSGIRYEYGDLNDVLDLLEREPLTRQAYLPIFFPEDTGAVHGDRIPCSLGYHFILRHGYLHCVYYLRSCDFVRHFRDDLYLTVRLMLWVLEKLKDKSERWNSAQPGTLTTHITSLHMFKNDYIQLTKKPS